MKLFLKLLCTLMFVSTFTACQKQKLPSVEFVIKLDGHFIDNGDTIHRQDEQYLRILEDNKANMLVLSNTFYNYLSKNSNGQVDGIITSTGRFWSIYNGEDAHIGYGSVSISGQYEKKKGKIKIIGNYNANIVISQSTNTSPFVVSFPITGTFEIAPK